MKRTFFFSSLVLALSSPLSAETVRTTDGRSIILHDDGTYDVLKANKQADTDFVEYLSHYFEHKVSEYGPKKVHFAPIYTNISEGTIVGTKFNVHFLNAFGDEIFKFSGETSEPVPPGESSTSNLVYIFEDNQFIPGEPYDKLLPMVRNKTGSIEVEITMIALEGGEVLRISK